MKLYTKISLSYFVAILPITLVVMLFFPQIMHTSEAQNSTILEFANAMFGVCWIVWVVNALYIGMSLIFSPKYRELLLTKLTHIRERDEREEYVVAKATRNSFLFNLAVMVFLLLIATVQISYRESPKDQAVDGKKHSLSVGLRFDPWDTKADTSKDSDSKIIYENRVPLTTSGILMLLILSQLGSYYVYARRQMC